MVEPKTAPDTATSALADLTGVFRALAAHAPLPMATVAGPGHILRHANPAFCRLLGKPEAEIVGRPFGEVLPATDECASLVDSVFRTGTPASHTEAGESKAVPVFWAYTMWPVIEGGHPIGVVIQVTETAAFREKTLAMNEALILGAVRQHELAAAADAVNARLQQEIGERKRAEKRLRRSEERYRALFAAVPVAVFVCDRDGRVESYNSRASELWGRKPAIGDPRERYCGSARLYLPDGTLLSHEQSPMLDVLRTGFAAKNVEMQIERPDGSRIPVLVNFAALKNEEGEITGAITSFDDIGELKRAQASARAAGERFHLIAESIPQKIFTATPGGELDYFNRQWVEYTGLAPGQLLESGLGQCIHPDDLAENFRIWRHSIETGEPLQFEHRIRSADGEFRWHTSRALALRDAAGATLMWLGSSTDIHELKEADDRKTEFLALLAHELRNPLAPIRYMLEIMKRADGNAAMITPALGTIERQVGHMTRLIDDLLDVSRIGRGRLQLRREEVELATVIRGVVEAARPACEAARHELTVVVPAPPIYLNADPVRLAQVFGNLLHNACKFTAPGGRVALEAERQGDDVVVTVRDSGIGIPAEMLPRVFEMFAQGDQSLERSRGGLGIGLTLVRRLVEMHGGSVHASSAGTDQGSEFVVRLPALVRTLQTTSPDPAVGEPAATPVRRILVVDDNHDAADALAMLLRMTGNETYLAFDGMEAVDAAAKWRPDVVLLDIGMPKLNGYDAARRIRGEPWGKAMVLVALTGWGQEEDRKRTAAAGFDGHLVKPVEYTALAKLLSGFPPAGRPG